MPIFTKPDSSTQFLMHCNELNGVATYKDYGPNNYTITNLGNCDHAQGSGQFASLKSACWFTNADNAYLRVDNTTVGDFGNDTHAGAFTVDLWAKISQAEVEASDREGVCSRRAAGQSSTTAGGWFIDIYSSQIHLGGSFDGGWHDGGEGIECAYPTDAAWHHIAVVRTGYPSGYYQIYIDGVRGVSWLSGTGNQMQGQGSDKFCIGNNAYDDEGATEFGPGAMEEFRLSTVARWTHNFTPPTAPYNIISFESIDVIEAAMTKPLEHTQETATLVFTESGTFVVPSGGIQGAEVLIVAGGGGGGSSVIGSGGGGGGGAGGLIHYVSQDFISGTITVTVGAGGAAGAVDSSAQGSDGGDSSVTGLTTAVGGGGGADEQGSGREGGSGGGGGYAGYTTVSNGGAATAGQGNVGSGVVGASASGGGGGGAGAAGDVNTGSSSGWGGVGGAGLIYGISGERLEYSRGGTAGDAAMHPTPLANRGFGGHGEYAAGAQTLDAGSDGIVIIRMKKTYYEALI
jgi:hypothetical protein